MPESRNNTKRLTQIAMLKNNWDGYGAKSLPRDTIFRAIEGNKEYFSLPNNINHHV
ncbi:MAG: hypothetical protein IJS39_06600 [Synergistaceae bacterium]|nr:hypothetical protein [Synergistaceae bacterium]